MTALTVDGRPRTLHVEHCMGTVFTIDIRDPGSWVDAIAEAVAWLRRVDQMFSTYRADSDISRVRRRELAVEDAHPDVAAVVDLCAVIEAETDGYFTPFWDTDIDPTGLVKGWAIEQASRLLAARGSRNHSVNGGGDVQLAGVPAPGRPWRVGISDPFDRTRVLSVVEGSDFAVATSGTAERGAHIVNPVTGAAAGELASVTVVGRSLTRCDAYATAAFARGRGARRWMEGVPDHEALIVSTHGLVTQTAGFPVVDPTAIAEVPRQVTPRRVPVGRRERKKSQTTRRAAGVAPSPPGQAWLPPR
ncbi:MAG TPA: FAD:protein FMN transferase [Acidimicrobiales bacterium]|nr:FAD:protein FMN transferase [Acidimicrobiales bacterium]